MSSPTVPKYSWEILAIQAVVIIACIVLLVLDEYRLYAYLFLPLMLSYVIQYYRIRRTRQRLNREFALQIRQVIAEHQYRAWGLHEPQHDINDDLKCLREEIERHKLAKAE